MNQLTVDIVELPEVLVRVDEFAASGEDVASGVWGVTEAGGATATDGRIVCA